jgi:hypothetical protein
MRRRIALLVVAVLAAGLLVASLAGATGGKSAKNGKRHKADTLSGYQENPDVSTTGGGRVSVKLNDKAQTITYTLKYSGLEGDVIQAHIHFAKPAVNGGIAVWLCGTAAAPGPAGTPECPAEGKVSRTLSAADIVGPAAQGIEPMSYEELAAAIRAGHAYANVHSTKWPGGEIRGQINHSGKKR